MNTFSPIEEKTSYCKQLLTFYFNNSEISMETVTKPLGTYIDKNL